MALVAACAHRTHQRTSRSLESLNASRMQGAPSCALAMSPEDAADCAAMLGVLGSLLARRDHVVAVTNERLPSTLMKLLKALASSDAASRTALHPLADAAFTFLGVAIAYDEVVQELIDANTLHRLFMLSFPSARALHLAGLAVRFPSLPVAHHSVLIS